MAKKAPAKKAPAKRKPRPKNAIVDSAPQLAELAKRMEVERARIIAQIEAEEAAKQMLPIPVDPTDYGESLDITSWIPVFLKYVATLLVGAGIGVYAAGGIQIGGDVLPVADAVSEVFDTQEAAFRKLNGELEQKLIAGEVKSENEAKTWMESNFLPQSEAAWIKLLEAEKAEFGGDKWTAEKQAAVIGRYAR